MNWLRYLMELPGAAAAYTVGKYKSFQTSKAMLEHAAPLELSLASVERLLEGLKSMDRKKKNGYPTQRDWQPEERELINHIRAETKLHNLNNVTRTEAYRTVYFHSPELHWALLAHLVSRNGGWNMTDLKGEWLPRLLNAEQCDELFMFLERCNALIFSDAYPQLLLYQWSRRQGRSLFHLLPGMGVSSFMEPVWSQFWRESDSVLLTIALIINEQHYIEERVVRNPQYKLAVHSLLARLQAILQLNGVVFPYGLGGEGACGSGSELQLAGLVIENFGDLSERIQFGKRLYAMLFGIPPVLHGARCFAGAVTHTGSRADYAPFLFQKKNKPRDLNGEKISGGKLINGADPLYSPELADAWGNIELREAEAGDWYGYAGETLPFFEELSLPKHFEISNEYGMMLDKLEFAALASRQGYSDVNS